MSKHKVQTTVEDDLNVILYEYIENIRHTIKNTGTGDLQDILSAILNKISYLPQYKPFRQDMININTLLTSDPLTVISFIKDRYFTAEDIREFQAHGREIIAELANPSPIDEYDLAENNILICTNDSKSDLSSEIIGYFTENLVQQNSKSHKGLDI